MLNFRTDLAMEAREALAQDVPEGVAVRHSKQQGFEVTHVRILTHEAGRTLGKLPGNYVTLEHTDLAQADSQVQNDCAAIMAQQLRTMLPAHLSGAPALVVGLGNKNITPDALGPCAAGRIFVTRHLIENCSITQIDGVPLNSVCAFSPGVLGVTGMQTEMVVRSVCAQLHPCCVLCIDALAAMSAARLLCTIQLSDSGIAPGSGVGNHAQGLDQSALGVPVIAIGVPTVVYASVLAAESAADTPHLAASNTPQDMLVTPRNIDEATDILSQIVADGINLALQPELSLEVMRN